MRDPSKDISTTECFGGSDVSVALIVGSIVGGIIDVGDSGLWVGGTGWQEVAIRRMVRVGVSSLASRFIKFPFQSRVVFELFFTIAIVFGGTVQAN